MANIVADNLSTNIPSPATMKKEERSKKDDVRISFGGVNQTVYQVFLLVRFWWMISLDLYNQVYYRGDIMHQPLRLLFSSYKEDKFFFCITLKLRVTGTNWTDWPIAKS